MSTLSDLSFTARVCIDWADDKHDLCLQGNGGLKEFACIEHSPESIDVWALALHKRFGGQIAVALELSRGPLVYALQKYDFFTLFPIHPGTLASYRETWHPSHAKNDPTDAELGLDMVIKHPERFKALNPQSDEMRELTFLTEHRRRIVGDQVRCLNRLTNTLKQYYPQPLVWFTLHNTLLFCAFLERWPTLKAVSRARKSTLKNFFNEHGSRQQSVVEKRLEAIKLAKPLTEDVAVINAHSRQMLVLVQQLRTAIESIKQYDHAIDKLANAHSDYFLFECLPGAGPGLAPRVMTAMGEQRDRFGSASDVQKCMAIAPVLEESGKKSWVHWRTGGSTFLRQTFIEWAAHSRHHSYWAGEYYQQQREKGKTHNVAVRALAFKWIRILYRCWQDRKPYDEAKYMKSLKKRGSPLVAEWA